MKLILCANCSRMYSAPNAGDAFRADCTCGKSHAALDTHNTLHVTDNVFVFGVPDADIISAVGKRAKVLSMYRIDVPCATVKITQEK